MKSLKRRIEEEERYEPEKQQTNQATNDNKNLSDFLAGGNGEPLEEWAKAVIIVLVVVIILAIGLAILL